MRNIFPPANNTSAPGESLELVGRASAPIITPTQLSGGQQQRVAIGPRPRNRPPSSSPMSPWQPRSQTSIEIMGVFPKAEQPGHHHRDVTHELEHRPLTPPATSSCPTAKVVSDTPVTRTPDRQDELRKLPGGPAGRGNCTTEP